MIFLLAIPVGFVLILYHLLEKMVIGEITFQGVRVRIIPGDKPEAFTFLSKIYVTKGALSKEDLEATLWHEMGHLVERHSWIMLAYSFATFSYYLLTLDNLKYLFLLILTIPLIWAMEIRANIYAAKNAGADKVLKMLRASKTSIRTIFYPPKRLQILAIQKAIGPGHHGNAQASQQKPNPRYRTQHYHWKPSPFRAGGCFRY